MDFKTFWKESLAGFIVKRILLAIVILVTLAWITLILIDQYTHHGESVTVPDLQGLYIEEAQNLLENYDLYTQVIDSVYVKDKALGTIVEQIPPASSSVKKNRSIYLILNKRQVKMVPFPEVNDVSFRQADALIKSLGLKVSGVVHRPSEFKDLVIDVSYNGQHIEAGTRVPEGSAVVLVVGSGVGEEISIIPNLIGKTFTDARNEAFASSFIIGAVNYDTPPVEDEDQYMIYRQTPLAGQKIPDGTRINIWLTKDKDLIERSFNNQFEEEEFF
ncbi:MAG: PASTA domain-containing protein [Paludibacter sp.]|nr:PASTA domain-containing protein [Paludibacter sp.]MDD4427217.1 PASTA domain-containing protein [Paludibacter sp.]